MLITTTNVVPYTISGSVPATFDIPFKYFTKSEIIAYWSLNQIVRPGEKPLTLVEGVDYSLSDPGDIGTLSRLGTWDTDGVKLTICRVVDLEQAEDLRNGDTYNANTIERLFDYCMAALQQVNEQIKRSFYAPITDGDVDLEMPTKEERGGHSFAFNASGEEIVVSDRDVAGVTPFIETLLDDTTAEAARTTLDVYSKSNLYRKDEAYNKTEIDSNINQGVKTTDSPEFVKVSVENEVNVSSHNFKIRPVEILGSIGNAFSIGTISCPEITRLDDAHIAFFDNEAGRLETYEWDGSDWVKIGNTFTITGAGMGNLTALSSTRVAFVDISNDKIGAYDWDGTNWSLIGSLFSLTVTGNYHITALTSSRIALVNSNEGLSTYDFNGSVWSKTGNTRTTTRSSVSISAIDDTHIFFMKTSGGFLVYDWNGTDWSVTTSAQGSCGSSGHIETLTPNDFIVVDDSNNNIRLMHWDEERNVIEEVDSFSLTTTSAGLCRLENNTFVVVNDSGETMITYKYRLELST